MDLTSRTCAPCKGGIAKLNKLTPDQIVPLAAQVPAWAITDTGKLHRHLKFGNFVKAMAFVNRMADLAEGQGHHPDFAVSYSTVNVTVWTHDVGGLSENDFILAAKIEQLIESSADLLGR